MLFSQPARCTLECDERDHHTHRAKTDMSMEPLLVNLAHGTLAAHKRMVVSYYVALWHAPASSARFSIYLILEPTLPGINLYNQTNNIGPQLLIVTDVTCHKATRLGVGNWENHRFLVRNTRFSSSQDLGIGRRYSRTTTLLALQAGFGSTRAGDWRIAPLR